MHYRPIPVKPLFAPKREKMILGSIPMPRFMTASTPVSIPVTPKSIKAERKHGIFSKLASVFGRRAN